MARGSGAASLQGMAAASELDGIALLRPLLAVRRATTRAACTAESLTPWDDPHNDDPRFARVLQEQRARLLERGNLELYETIELPLTLPI